MIDELIAQREVFLLRDPGEVSLLVQKSSLVICRRSSKPDMQDLWLQPDLGRDTKQQLYDIGLNVFSYAHASRADCAVDEIHERHSEDIIFKKVLLFAIDERIVEGHRIPNCTLIVCRRGDFRDCRIYLLGGGELEAHMRCR
jgi:hypothetical protein